MLDLFHRHETRRRQAVASARLQQAAEHRAAVARLAGARGVSAADRGEYTRCPYCPDRKALIRRDLLVGHLAAVHASLVGENP